MRPGTTCRRLRDLRGTMSDAMITERLSCYRESMLSPTTPTILRRFFVDGLSYTKIGAEIGMSRQAVYQRVKEFVARTGQ